MKITEHLALRGVTDKIKMLSVTEDTAVFPLYTFTGQLVGFHQYRPAGSKGNNNDPTLGKYYTISSQRTVWGLEYLDPTKPVLFVVEGVFDAMKLVSLGYNAIAVLSNDPVKLRETIRSLPYKRVAVCDHGKAGAKLAKYADVALCLYPQGDLGDLSFEETKLLAEQVLCQW